jgi:hypothetical protein
MRWSIIRVLLQKEILRQAANRGGIALGVLLVVASLLMTLFSNHNSQLGGLPSGVDTCFIDYWQDDGWVQHLRNNVPSDLAPQIQFRHESQAQRSGGLLVYAAHTGAIQMRVRRSDDGKTQTKIWVWYPDSDGSALAPYERWFWRESTRYFQQQAALAQQKSSVTSTEFQQTASTSETRSSDMPDMDHHRQLLKGAFDIRLSVTAALVLFALFFSCVYLLPSLMCEERERGVLLAQALSPASPLEILAAKFLFYPVVGIALAALLAGISKPLVLLSLFFWLALIAASFGSLGIGLTIACVAQTQRTASMGALCYMLVVAIFLFICQQGEIPLLPYLALEYHCPRMLHAALSDAVLWYHWVNLLATAVLAVGWGALATWLFRRRGWQS